MIGQFLKLLSYGACVYVSFRYAGGYWVVGPVFGLTVAAWDCDFVRKPAVRHLSFFAASTLIYALVFHLSSQNWLRGSDLAESLYGPLPIAVMVGSALLPITHKFTLGAPDKSVVQVIPLLIFSYYAVAFFSIVNDQWKLNAPVNFLFVMIAAWQGIYLAIIRPGKN